MFDRFLGSCEGDRQDTVESRQSAQGKLEVQSIRYDFDLGDAIFDAFDADIGRFCRNSWNKRHSNTFRFNGQQHRKTNTRICDRLIQRELATLLKL